MCVCVVVCLLVVQATLVPIINCEIFQIIISINKSICGLIDETLCFTLMFFYHDLLFFRCGYECYLSIFCCHLKVLSYFLL